MAEEKHDLIVIGGGPAGYVGAIRAAQMGKKVALIERDRAGGTCLNWGCIPTKALIRNAEVYRLVQKAADFGIQTGSVSFEWDRVIARSRGVSDRIAKGLEFLFKKNKIETISGQAQLGPDRSVRINGQTLGAEKVLLATGAKPRLIPGFQPDGKKFLTSREAMVIPKRPDSILIIGGGAIGIEFAYFFNSFGTKVTVVEALPSILPKEDHEISGELSKIFTRSGIRILTGTTVDKLIAQGEGVEVALGGAFPATEQFETVLCAIGVVPHLDFLTDPNQLVLEKGFVKTDDHYQTSIPGVYGAGDLIGPPWLAHVASYEAIQAVEGMFGEHAPSKPKVFPSCTYCHPQVASTGLTENECKARGIAYKVGKYPFLSSGKALAQGDNQGFVKLINSEPDGRLLGCHIIGADATELIAEMALAMNFELTAADIAATVHAHPTLSEIVFEAAEMSLGKAIHG
ncbi:MAG: dihydrolipoyl dehydrogenase [Verrucomicrobiae bacterium]|nr:dihydrolipoyl dehydrogenase [Verrucomicrobiae bacterium]